MAKDTKINKWQWGKQLIARKLGQLQAGQVALPLGTTWLRQDEEKRARKQALEEQAHEAEALAQQLADEAADSDDKEMDSDDDDMEAASDEEQNNSDEENES